MCYSSLHIESDVSQASKRREVTVGFRWNHWTEEGSANQEEIEWVVRMSWCSTYWRMRRLYCSWVECDRGDLWCSKPLLLMSEEVQWEETINQSILQLKRQRQVSQCGWIIWNTPGTSWTQQYLSTRIAAEQNPRWILTATAAHRISTLYLSLRDWLDKLRS